MLERMINILITIMLIEMMVAVGLGVKIADLIGVAKNWRLLFQAGLANYVFVPAVTVSLLMWFHPADPLTSAGFLILAVCPGAPFGPPCTGIAKGNVAVSVGLMVLLAASSAIVAPLLLRLLLPWLPGDQTLQVDAVKIVGTLLITQLLPLCVALLLRQWRPDLADRLQRPANLASPGLGIATVRIILVVHLHDVTEIGWRGWAGMLALLIATLALGGLLGGPGTSNRKAVALTTSLRNVGVGLVIAAGNFPDTAAVTAVVIYGLFEILGSLLLALVLKRPRIAAYRCGFHAHRTFGVAKTREV